MPSNPRPNGHPVHTTSNTHLPATYPTGKRLDKNGQHRGRPRGVNRKYNGDTANAIIEHVAQGGSLREICSRPDMPGISQVCGWAIGAVAYSGTPPTEDFQERFAQAVLTGCHVNAMDLIPEARKAAGQDMAGVAAQKLIVDTIKWDLSKRLRDQFGDRMEVTNTGGNVQVHITLPALEGTEQKVIEGTATEVEESE